MKCIVNGKVLLEEKILEGKVLVFDKQIVDILDEAPNDAEIIDAKGMFISPGLIDIHIHGNMGKDTMDGTTDAVNTISKSIVRHGVTSFLPTTMTMDKASINKSLDAIRECMENEPLGARPIGVHLEGPFINIEYKGAQNPKYIVKSSYDFIKANQDIIKVITYAPETDTNLEFTRDIKKNTNITLSIGHSNATYDEAKEAIDLGATNVTHLFNGMSGLNHRNPGVVGAALISKKTYCEIIADTIHFKKDLFQFLLDNKGKEKLILITDSIEAGGLEDGEYSLGGQKVFVKDGQARLESGSLAGSVTPINVMIKNFYENTNLKVNEVINMASLNPAKSIKIDDKKGSIQIGKDADITIFDEEFNCHMTIVGGNILYKK